jgi:hypothetical protein
MSDIFIVRFYRDSAYISESKALPLSNVLQYATPNEFPDHAYFKCRILDYKVEERKIIAKIVSYHSGEADFTDIQYTEEIFDEAELIHFMGGIDTGGLFLALNGKHRSASYIKHQRDEYNRYKERDLKELDPDYTPEPKTLQIPFSFSVSLKEFKYNDGYISFQKKIKEIDRTLEIRLSNPEVTEKYDAIKEYFPKALKIKRAKVEGTITIIDNKIEKIEAISQDANRINNSLFEEVKSTVVNTVTKDTSSFPADQAIVSIDEFLKQDIADNISLKHLFDDEKSLFNGILDITQSKHYNNMRYLADNHDTKMMKLRVIRKPFSYLFLLAGNKNYYFVWEVLNKEEATYIWKVQKNIVDTKKQKEILKSKLSEITDIISNTKKADYLSQKNDHFFRLYHDYSDPLSGYEKWRKDLEAILE